MNGTLQNEVSSGQENGRFIQFVDADNKALFTVEDGANIVLTALDGSQSILPCRCLNAAYAMIGDEVWHLYQFAILQERQGSVYAPECPKEGDICDTYEIYQLKDRYYGSDGCFYSYELAKDSLRPSHYEKVFAGVLQPQTTLDDLFHKHNTEYRPRRMAMRSMSISDMVITIRDGKKQAFCVDSAGFQAAEQFLKPKRQSRKRPSPER